MIELRDNHGSTPLHHAAENNQSEIITFLHERGADIYAKDQSLCTPVLTAAAHNRKEAFHCLMKLMDLNDHLRSPIFQVLHVKKHQAETLKFLITDYKWGSKLVKSTDSQKNCVLHVTARENDVSSMAVLMEHKVESYIKNVDGKTPMHLAAEMGHHDSVLQLMKYDRRLVTTKDNHEMTPLHLACLHGHISIVHIHKDHSHLKSVCEWLDAEGNTPLHLACSGGNAGIVELLIDSGADTKATNKRNEMPLHIAVSYGHVPIAQLLLEKQVPIECQTVEGHTPLHYAARANISEMISLLVDSEADLYAKDSNCCTPTHIAAMHQYTDAYHCLMEYIPVDLYASVIFTAFDVQHSREVILEFLVKDDSYGKTLCHATNKTGNTPLHIASECGCEVAVNILLDHGACSDAQNCRLETPMHLAAAKGMERIVQQLIGHDPKLMLCKSIRGRTPLHTACQHGQTEVVRILTLSMGKLFEAVDTSLLEMTGSPPLDLSCAGGSKDPVQLMNQIDSEIVRTHTLITLFEASLLEITDSMKNTPLHLACMDGSKDSVQLLIDSGADLNQVNLKGEAAIHIAAQHGFIPIAEILLANGVDIECQSEIDMRTPLHHAAKCNQHEMIGFLRDKGANLYEEDCHFCTPVLLAASSNTIHAFDCLMAPDYLDLKDTKQNPMFQVLKLKSRQEKYIRFLANNKTCGQTLKCSTADNGNTPLHAAARQGNHLAVKVMLDEGFDARKKNEHCQSPMHLAAKEGRYVVVREFISHDALLVMEKDANGMIPLHLACLGGKLESVLVHHSQLSQLEVREAQDFKLNTPLHLACKCGNRKIAEYLIKVRCSMNALNSDKDHLIHVAVRNGHLDVTKLLLDQNTSIESLDACKRTPLHIAAMHDQACIIQHLKERNAALYAEDCNSLTPVLTAAVQEKAVAFCCLMEYVDMSDSKQNPIFKAIEIKCMWETVLNFILHDAEWGLKLQQSVDSGENTPLHAAARHGNLTAVKILLHCNFDVYATNCDGKFPIHLAAEEGHYKIVFELIQHNPQLSVARDANERTPLHIACLSRHRDVANIINLSLNEVLHATDLNGNTPLHLACEGRSEEVVQLLIDSGANINQTNNEGEIPTHVAVQYGSINIVKMLQQKCADTLQCQDKYKQTVLHHAAIGKHNQEEMITFLHENCDANLYAEDHNSHTPILTSAVQKQVTAFQHFMKYVDLKDSERNPIFKTLCVKWKQAEILEFMISDSTWGTKLSGTTTKSGNTPLHVAACDGNQEAVGVLLKLIQKTQVKVSSKQGKLPIHLAAESGHYTTVEQFIKYDSKLLEEPDADGRNALHLACLEGHLNVVHVISEHMSEEILEACDNQMNRPLHLACESNSADIVKLLVEMEADTTARNHKDELPLHIAARKGNVQIGELLVTEVDLAEMKDSEGRNPLHNAAYHNQEEMIRFFCKSDTTGTLLYDEDQNHCTPVLIAAACEHKGAFHCLMEYVNPKKYPIFKAFYSQYKKEIILQFMINDEWGEKLSCATNEDNRTPLHIAAEMGNEMITDLLIKKCVDFENVKDGLVGAKDRTGMIPLHLACRNGMVKVVKVHITNLDKSFQQVCEAQDNAGNTPLHYACENDRQKIVELLIDNGAQTTTKNNEMEAPIHIAAKSGFTVTAEMLLKSGVPIGVEGDHEYTPLHHAAENNHTEMIKMLCDRGAELYAEDERGYIPVMVASEYKRTEAFCCLMEYMKELEGGKKNPLFKVLDLKADNVLEFMLGHKIWCQNLCDTCTDHWNTPLHIAAMQGNLNAVKVLVKHQARTDAVNDVSKTAVHLAAETGGDEIVQELLELNPSLVKKVDNEEKGPLHLACQHAHFMVVYCILESQQYSKDVLEACDKKDNTPLHFACMGGDSGIVNLLIRRGAKTNATNAKKRTPLHTAAENGFVNVVQVLVNEQKESLKCWDDDKCTPLHLAAKHKHAHVIKFLHKCHLQQTKNGNLPKNADLHAEGDFHYTPAVLAAQAGCKKAFQYIMECFGNDDIQDVTKNPLFQALKVGDKASSAVEFMIQDSGEKLCKVTDDLNTLLHVAAKDGLKVIVKELLNHQATGKMLRDKNDRDMTPLHIACQEGHHDVLKVLEPHLSAEDLTQKDRERNTVLHLACEGGKKETVQLILDKAENVEVLISEQNVRGEAPIHFAAHNGFEDIVELLLKKGVAKDIKDNHGCTPLHHAARNDQEKMIEFLCKDDPELINLEDHDSHTPILTAAARSKVKAFQCLMKYQHHLKENPVFKALESEENPVAILKLMIRESKWGSKLHRVTNSEGNTPLHVAAKHGKLAAIRILLEGDSLNREMYFVNKEGKTPLHMAAEGGHTHVVGELIHYQSNTKELKDKNENTPLHLACTNGHLEVARLLLAPYLLLEKNEQGNTPLHLACMIKGNIGIVKKLIAAAAGVGQVNDLLNEKNKRNQTPIDLAYQEEDSDINVVLYLIGEGANVGLKPVFEGLSEARPDFNFLDWAIERKHRDIAMKIVESEYWEDALRSCHVVEDCSPYINPEVADVSHPAAAEQGVPPADVSHPAAAEQEVPLADVSHPAAAEQGIPPADVSHPAAAEQGVPPVDVSHPAAANQGVPPADVSHPAAAEQEVPLADVSHPAAAEQGIPLADVSHPAAADQGVPPADVNPPAAANQRVPPADVSPPAAADQGVPLVDVNPPAAAEQGIPPADVNSPAAAEQGIPPADINPPAAAESGVPLTDVSHPSAAEQGVPPTDVNPPAAAEQGIPPTDVNPPAAAEQGIPPADIHPPAAAADQGVPPADVNPPATTEQGVPPTKDRCHLTKTTPMRELVKEMPDVAEKVLDRCTEQKEYNYEFLEDFKQMPWPCCRRHENDDDERQSQHGNDHWGPKNFDRTNHPLAIMVKHRRSELLKHELVSTFLRQKFTKSRIIFYLADFFLYTLFLIFLTSYALTVPTPLDDVCTTTIMNGSDNASQHPFSVTQPMCSDWWTYIVAIFTFFFSAVRAVLQICELYMLIKRYCSSLRDSRWHNWKEFLSRSFFGTVRFLMFVFAIAFSAVFNFPCPCVTNGQWQVGVLAVFLGWINMITYIKLVPRLGVYVLMFLNVIYSFLKMFLLGLLLIIAFGLAFYMLFRTPSEMRTAFATPARALIKAMTMPLANFDFNGMFHLSDDEDEIAYVGASYLMWIVFVIILAILFPNLLTSVAVGDIQDVRQNALLRQRELHVELLLNFEELFPQTLGNMNEQRKSHKTYRIFEWIWELTSGASVVEQVHPLEHKLEQALTEIDGVKHAVSEHSRKQEETESYVKQLAGQHEVHENLAQQTSEKLDTIKDQLDKERSEMKQKLDTIKEQLGEERSDMKQKLESLIQQTLQKLSNIEQLNAARVQQSPAATSRRRSL